MQVSLTILIFATTSVLAGCGGEQPPLAPVTGAVLFQGKPLEEGAIVFEVPGRRQAAGKIVKGRIVEVSTYVAGDGAPVGPAQIAVFSQEPSNWRPPAQPPANPGEWTAENAPSMVTPSRIPERYNDPRSSELAWDIRPGTNEMLLELKKNGVQRKSD